MATKARSSHTRQCHGSVAKPTTNTLPFVPTFNTDTFQAPRSADADVATPSASPTRQRNVDHVRCDNQYSPISTANLPSSTADDYPMTVQDPTPDVNEVIAALIPTKPAPAKQNDLKSLFRLTPTETSQLQPQTRARQNTDVANDQLRS